MSAGLARALPLKPAASLFYNCMQRIRPRLPEAAYLLQLVRGAKTGLDRFSGWGKQPWPAGGSQNNGSKKPDGKPLSFIMGRVENAGRIEPKPAAARARGSQDVGTASHIDGMLDPPYGPLISDLQSNEYSRLAKSAKDCRGPGRELSIKYLSSQGDLLRLLIFNPLDDFDLTDLDVQKYIRIKTLMKDLRMKDIFVIFRLTRELHAKPFYKKLYNVPPDDETMRPERGRLHAAVAIKREPFSWVMRELGNSLPSGLRT
ncbi:hypothetical protein BDK51DRAFT_32184 [Blyttiomyces helicus]|uniref:Uncharacterized protein n=1 Tax=Blyttiomyces helicus TaxID=388810 RepID=A0A4P9W6H4_9FUNG|nr:hypothetical protein BDK51DRAFT_32184 [Blyttiomyces helicus]|eukprot:RKO85726.1 hypothetical protein BDK51DRAFT_32184 [Blyttiomyces helicus]